MTTINLLPWREERAARKKIILTYAALLGVLIVSCIILLLNTYVKRISLNQEYLNQGLYNEIEKLRAQKNIVGKIIKAHDLSVKKKQTLSLLQHNKAMVLHIFKSLSEIIPAGVTLTHMKMRGSHLTLIGYAKYSQLISSMTRALSQEAWIKSVVISDIKKNEFRLNIDLVFNV